MQLHLCLNLSQECLERSKEQWTSLHCQQAQFHYNNQSQESVLLHKEHHNVCQNSPNMFQRTNQNLLRMMLKWCLMCWILCQSPKSCSTRMETRRYCCLVQVVLLQPSSSTQQWLELGFHWKSLCMTMFSAHVNDISNCDGSIPFTFCGRSWRSSQQCDPLLHCVVRELPDRLEDPSKQLGNGGPFDQKKSDDCTNMKGYPFMIPKGW